MSSASRRLRRRLLGLVVLLIMVLAGLPGGVPLVRAASLNIVISQVYGGGGNTGAPYTNDFVELYNRGTTAVSVEGWSVQYASATGTGNLGANSGQLTVLPSMTLQPGQYLLVQEAGGATGSPLPAPDATGAINMSATGGKVALVTQTAGLGCNGGSTPCSVAQLALIKDLVGYDGANFFEGAAAAPAASNTLSVQRAGNGSQDTDDNAADFVTGAPNPRNSGFTPPPPPPSGCDVPVTHEIAQVQGAGDASPVAGQTVRVEGVVTGDFQGTSRLNGFFLQDDTPDGNPATSDGLFAFGNPASGADDVHVGDRVRVSGRATEFNGLTELSPVTAIDICGSGTIAVTDVTMPFASANYPERYEGMLVRFPQSLVISEYFNYDRFGEIVLAQPLDGEARPFTGTAIDTPGAAANARTLANSLSRITLDDAQSAQNPPVLRHPNGDAFSLSNRFRGGDTVQDAVGVLGFDFSLYRIYPTGPADYTAANPRPAAPEAVGGKVRVAAMNTLNFFVTLDTTANDSGPGPCGANQNLDCRGADADQPLEFTRQRDKLLAALSGLDADIIGLNELENTPGAEPLDSIVSGMPGYDYIHTGTIGTDAIKVGMIYRPAVVTPIGSFKLLTSAVDPRFIDTKSRPSLAQTFEVNATGARFTVVVNHFKSKGSACDDVGDPDLGDGQGNCSQTRRAAAEALVDWLATDPTGSGDADFLIVGDLNSYAKENTLTEIQAGADDTAGTSDDFTNLIAQYQGKFAYSYTFDGQAGYLDHALANATLLPQITGAADWHINSDEPDVLDYDTSFKPPAQEALYEPNAYRTSDHDPVVVGLDLIAYDFDGFYQPVDNLPTVNSVKAGSAIPVKFTLGGDRGLNIFFQGYPSSQQVACSTGDPIDDIESTVTAGASVLSYDSTTDTYTYAWKTNKAWSGTCRQLIVLFKDGTIRRANFQFK